MNKQIEAMKQALYDLIAEYHMERSSFAKRVDDIFKETLAEQPAQEPVEELLLQSKKNFERNFGPAWQADWVYSDLAELLAESLPQAREWAGLTHDEYDAICDKHSAMSDFDFLAEIEAKLRKKNGITGEMK